MSQAKATAVLDLNIKGFEQAIGTAKKLLVGLAGAFAAFKGIQLFKNGVTGAIAFGDEMYHLADKLGMVAGEAFVISKAFEKAGVSQSEFVATMQEAVDSGRSLESFWQSTDGPEWVKGEYAEALRKAQLEYGKTGEILTRSAERFSKLQDLVNLVGSKLREVFLAMSEKFIKPLSAALRYFASVDFAGTAAKFGEMIEKGIYAAVGLIKNGEFFKALELGLTVLVQKFVSLIVKGFQSVLPLLIQMGAAIAKGISQAMKDDPLAKAIMKMGGGGKAKEKGWWSESFAMQKRTNAEKSMWAKFDGSEKSDAQKKLEELLSKAIEAGKKAMAPYTDEGRKEKIRWAAMGKQNPYSVIADSIQSQGGGGAYITSGLSIEAKEAMRQTAVAKENAEYNRATEENTRIMIQTTQAQTQALMKSLSLGQ